MFPLTRSFTFLLRGLTAGASNKAGQCKSLLYQVLLGKLENTRNPSTTSTSEVLDAMHQMVARRIHSVLDDSSIMQGIYMLEVFILHESDEHSPIA
jgi:hypothetical protein